jgi:hypothetical protein
MIDFALTCRERWRQRSRGFFATTQPTSIHQLGDGAAA